MDLLKMLLSLALTLFSGFVGSYFTASSIDNWYAYLIKPVLNPPNWVFAPVWTLLYLFMGLAFYIVWNSKTKNKKYAFKVFFIQLTLNTLWSIVFFGLRNPSLAFLVIIALWLAIAWTIAKFNEINKRSAYLLLPYLVWVSFAAYLNLAIWLLN